MCGVFQFFFLKSMSFLLFYRVYFLKPIFQSTEYVFGLSLGFEVEWSGFGFQVFGIELNLGKSAGDCFCHS